MKNLFTLLLYIFVFFQASSVASAITATPSTKPTTKPTAGDSSVGEQINDLKERIASRVAELKLVEKRGIIGTVTNVSDTQVTITDTNDTRRFIDVDELTKFSSPSAKEAFGISDLSKGTKLGILGLYNKQSKRILARFVNVVSIPIFISGTVANRDDEEFTVSITQEDGIEMTVDIEKTTKTLLYADNELEKSGFSKVEQGQRAIAIGYPDGKEKNRMSALRILLFPTLITNPKITTSPTPVAKKTSTSTKSAILQSEKTTQQ